MPLGIMRAGPVVAIDYAKAKVDGYTEEGDAALALNVDSGFSQIADGKHRCGVPRRLRQ